jgi:hypothetical protein
MGTSVIAGEEMDRIARDPDVHDRVARRGLDLEGAGAYRELDLPRSAEEPVADHARPEHVLATGRGRDFDALRPDEQPERRACRRLVRRRE